MMQPKVEARVKGIVEVDGLRFRDSDGDGWLTPYEDWRLTPDERARDLVGRMTLDEKLGLFVINTTFMGLSQPDASLTSHDGVIDEEDSNAPHMGHLPPTTELIEQRHVRHLILREQARAPHVARWVNTLNEIAEGTRLGIPVIVASNSRNERGTPNMRPTSDDQTFTFFPGTLGIAATRDLEVVRRWAEIGRREFLAANIRKGYMYMADVVTDPRWFRINGTLGEDPAFIADAIRVIIETYQGTELGPDSIALTTKHFPGGGARENGFDPHYAEGKFNVYPTPHSLERYHLPPFQAAIDAGTSSVMPYYAIPSEEKSARPQPPFDGEGEFEQVGFAFNQQIIDEIYAMGHGGYVNSDTGVLEGMAWGVEDLDQPERVAKAMNAGTDILAGSFEISWFREAHDRGLLSDERIDDAARKLLAEMFALGLFDNPYVDAEAAGSVVRCEEHEAAAAEAHRKSVVLLKNSGGVLPLRDESLAGKRVYLELFEKDLTVAKLDALRTQLAAKAPGVTFTTDPAFADVAILYVNPFTGDYFKSTGLLDLRIHNETNVDMDKIRRIREQVGTVVVALNIFLPWVLTDLEPLADAILAGFETDEDALLEAALGVFAPTGKLPLTLPASDDAIAVDENGICASPNDVPGYDKERYMDGRPYVYTDADGNRYQLGHGLTY